MVDFSGTPNSGGQWDPRRVGLCGVTLGQCDLNFLSVKAMTEIENVCGIPGTVDTPAENQCRIRAVVSPDPSPAADHRKLYRVLEVWAVVKR